MQHEAYGVSKYVNIDDVAALLNAQWDFLLLQQRIIRSTEIQLSTMRGNLNLLHEDRETRSTASLASLSSSRQPSSISRTSSDDHINAAFAAPPVTIQNRETLCPLPTRTHMAHCFFNWSDPPNTLACQRTSAWDAAF